MGEWKFIVTRSTADRCKSCGPEQTKQPHRSWCLSDITVSLSLYLTYNSTNPIALKIDIMEATTLPLSDRSTNTHLQPLAETAGLKSSNDCEIHSLEYHRQALHAKLQDGDNSQLKYVSPSDNIMSPCTRKLSDLKGKRFNNAGKPSTLFAKLGKKSFENSSSNSPSAKGKRLSSK